MKAHYLNNLEIEIAKEISNTENTNNTTIRALEKFKERIEQINKNNPEKVSLIFIGEKGVGKTTLICRLLNLVYKKKKRKPNGKEFEIFEDILQTGSGATTIAQVSIRGTSDPSYIEIKPYPRDVIKEYLESFAKYIFLKVHDSVSGNDSNVDLPIEIERACRNITQLKIVREGESRTDNAILLANSFLESEYKLFLYEIFKRSNLDYRTQTTFKFKDTDNIKEIDWLRKSFRDINLVASESIPLPKEIIIYLGHDIFDFNELDFVDQIVDTRGLDSFKNNDRRDIINAFRKESNDLIIITDQFKAPSVSILNLLSTYIYDKNTDLLNRVLLLINFRDNEPNQLIDCEGEVNNEETGIDVRRNQILMKLNENEIPFKEGNIVFYNPLRFLDNEKRLLITADDIEDYGEEASKGKMEIISVERTQVINQIRNISLYGRTLIEEEIKKIEADFDKLKKMHNSGNHVKIQINSLLSDLNNNNIRISVKEKMVFFYEEYLGYKYPSTISAINKRYGIFNDNDIFSLGASELENEMKFIFKEAKDQTLIFFESILKLTNPPEEQKIILRLAIKEINSVFPRFMNKLHDVFYKEFENSVFPKEDSIFWNKSQQRWGMGSGYKEDIKDYYTEQIRESEFYNQIEDRTIEYYRDFIKLITSIINQLVETN